MPVHAACIIFDSEASRNILSEFSYLCILRCVMHTNVFPYPRIIVYINILNSMLND